LEIVGRVLSHSLLVKSLTVPVDFGLVSPAPFFRPLVCTLFLHGKHPFLPNNPSQPRGPLYFDSPPIRSFSREVLFLRLVQAPPLFGPFTRVGWCPVIRWLTSYLTLANVAVSPPPFPHDRFTMTWLVTLVTVFGGGLLVSFLKVLTSLGVSID